MKPTPLALVLLLAACSDKAPVTDDSAQAADDSAAVDDSAPDSGDSGDSADSGDSGDTGGDTGADLCAAPVTWTDATADASWDALAADFSVNTTDGPWSLAESWTGCESTIVELYYEGSSYSESLWDTNPSDILDASPDNVHYLFASYTEDEDTRLAEIAKVQADFDDALSKLTDEEADWWRAHIHYVTDSAWELGWPSDLGTFHFGIDRSQHIRDIGLLYNFRRSKYQLGWLAQEPLYYNYRQEQEDTLAALTDPVEVTIFDHENVGSGWSSGPVYTSVEIPDLSNIDTMYIDMEMDCDDSDGDGVKDCPEWDRQIDGYLCAADDDTDCTKSFGRWISTYYRPGHWLTDASALLPLLGDGGETRSIGFYSVDTWKITWKLIFANTKGDETRPYQVIPAWTGGSFDVDYNSRQEDLSFDVPADATRVEFVTMLTGHGSGTDTKNCAEFCNSEHHFTVNDISSYTQDFPLASTATGCQDQVLDGTVPNQYGTWPYGRAGWCPGKDVAPWSVDITDDVVIGGTNTLSYSATVDGADYEPVYTGGGDYYPDIQMKSWIMIWR